MGKRGQVSFEYLIVVGVALLIVSIAGLFALVTYNGFSDAVKVRQVQQAAQALVDTAETVYYYGAPTFIQRQIFVPEGVQTITVSQSEIIFRIQLSKGQTDVSAFATMNMSGSVPTAQGRQTVLVSAEGDYVSFN